MADLIPVRDSTTGEVGEVGRAWLDAWPGDFTEISREEYETELAKRVPQPVDEQPAAPAGATPPAAPAAPEPQPRGRF